MGVPQNGWFSSGKIPLKEMIWGYPYFRKPPNIFPYDEYMNIIEYITLDLNSKHFWEEAGFQPDFFARIQSNVGTSLWITLFLSSPFTQSWGIFFLASWLVNGGSPLCLEFSR